jgi:hypothetical protein
MVPHTNDNHPGYDYGSGLCSGSDVSGTPVNGMSVGFIGIVIRREVNALRAKYGPLILSNGNKSIVIIQFGHITPNVSINQKIDSTITIGQLNKTVQELEIQVLIGGRPIDPILIGLMPEMSYGPQK